MREGREREMREEEGEAEAEGEGEGEGGSHATPIKPRKDAIPRQQGKGFLSRERGGGGGGGGGGALLGGGGVEPPSQLDMSAILPVDQTPLKVPTSEAHARYGIPRGSPPPQVTRHDGVMPLERALGAGGDNRNPLYWKNSDKLSELERRLGAVEEVLGGVTGGRESEGGGTVGTTLMAMLLQGLGDVCGGESGEEYVGKRQKGVRQEGGGGEWSVGRGLSKIRTKFGGIEREYAEMRRASERQRQV